MGRAKFEVTEAEHATPIYWKQRKGQAVHWIILVPLVVSISTLKKC